MRRVRLVLGAVFLTALVALLSSGAIAEVAWRRYRVAGPAMNLPHANAALALEIGNYHFGIGAYDLTTAERAYRRALAIDPGIFWGHYQLARVLFLRGEHDEALQEANRELEANPENLRTLYVRALIQAARGDLAAAEDDFRRFVLWAPREWAGYNDLAWILSKRGRHAEARATILRALAEVPDAGSNPWLWNALGVARLNLGKHEEAAAAFERAQQLAEELTEDDWHMAYPGNDPAGAASGIAAFRAAVAENLRRAGRM